MRNILTALFLVFATNSVYSADVTIEMLNKNKETKERMVYSKELVKIEPGQSIEWIPTSKSHNVEILIGPKGYDLPEKSKLSKPVTINFTIPGIYLYQCSPHVALGGDNSNMKEVSKKKLAGSKAKKKRDKLLKAI